MNSANVLVFTSVISCAFAAMAIGPAQVDPAQPDKCFNSETSEFYTPGESWQLDYCGLSTCSLHNISGTPQLMVEYASCGVVVVDPPCYLKEDKSQQYPDCCPQPECPEDYSNEQQESDHDQQEQEKEDDFLNEIEDDEERDSAYNHKYNNKMVDEHSVKDSSRLADEEDATFYKQFDSAIPTNVNQYGTIKTEKSNHDRYQNILGQDQFTGSIEPTLQERNFAYLKALQEELLRYYPTLRRASPRFDYLSSGEFKDDRFQWF